MNETYEPSPDFVEKVMVKVHLFEAKQVTVLSWICASRPIRFALAGSGTLFGILKAAPVF
jgi:hypothetical protein